MFCIKHGAGHFGSRCNVDLKINHLNGASDVNAEKLVHVRAKLEEVLKQRDDARQERDDADASDAEPASGRREYVSPNRQETVSVSTPNQNTTIRRKAR